MGRKSETRWKIGGSTEKKESFFDKYITVSRGVATSTLSPTYSGEKWGTDKVLKTKR